MHQEGAAVYKFAIARMAEVATEIMTRNNLRANMIDWLVPHQANKRIIESTAERMGLPMERVMVTINKYGNTTNATIPLCLWDYEPKLKAGNRMLLAAFGGGFTWAGIYVQWAYDGAKAPKLNGGANGKSNGAARKPLENLRFASTDCYVRDFERRSRTLSPPKQKSVVVCVQLQPFAAGRSEKPSATKGWATFIDGSHRF